MPLRTKGVPEGVQRVALLLPRIFRNALSFAVVQIQFTATLVWTLPFRAGKRQGLNGKCDCLLNTTCLFRNFEKWNRFSSAVDTMRGLPDGATQASGTKTIYLLSPVACAQTVWNERIMRSSCLSTRIIRQKIFTTLKWTTKGLGISISICIGDIIARIHKASLGLNFLKNCP